jgi:tetratricopeptide (TPR) repeat protein
MATTNETFVDYYAILEITRDADDAQIKAAIKQQRRTWAKRQSHADQQRRHEAETRIRQIAEAERKLLDPDSRQQYDRQLVDYRPPSTPSSEVSGNWIDRTREFLQRGDAYSANYAAREATTLDSTNDQAWALRAQSSLLLGNLRDALFELQEALRIAPNRPEYHFDLGSVHEADGQWDPALRCYEKASQLVPDDIMYQLAIASVYIQKGDARRALPILDSVTTKSPDDEVANYYLAVALFETAIEDWPKFVDGGTLPTSAHQARTSLTKLQRAASLRTGDAEIDGLIQKGIKICNEALETKLRLSFWRLQMRRAGGSLFQFWEHPSGAGAGISLLLSGVLIGMVGLGFLLLLVGFTGEPGAFFGGLFWGGLGVGGVYLLWNKPGWWENAEELKWDRSEQAAFLRSRGYL